VVVITSGFGETGAGGKAREAELRAPMRRYPAMRVLGHNCLGVMVPRLAFRDRGLVSHGSSLTPRISPPRYCGGRSGRHDGAARSASPATYL
jgi:hypothetical protein